MELIVPVARRLPHVRFIVVGGQPTQIADWRRASGRQRNLSLVGAARPTDVPRHMRQFNIALLPNQPQVLLPNGDNIGPFTSPMKLFEYMAAGKAIVASDLPNLREVLRHEWNCLLVPHADPRAWAEAIERLRTDPLLRQRLSRQARADAVERYSYETRFQHIFRCFHLHDENREAA
jgi:glycosyltransferase involved in cell wall biosynthesis